MSKILFCFFVMELFIIILPLMFRVDWNVHFCFVIIFATVRSFIQKREDNLEFCFAKK